MLHIGYKQNQTREQPKSTKYTKHLTLQADAKAGLFCYYYFVFLFDILTLLWLQKGDKQLSKHAHKA